MASTGGSQLRGSRKCCQSMPLIESFQEMGVRDGGVEGAGAAGGSFGSSGVFSDFPDQPGHRILRVAAAMAVFDRVAGLVRGVLVFVHVFAAGQDIRVGDAATRDPCFPPGRLTLPVLGSHNLLPGLRTPTCQMAMVALRSFPPGYGVRKRDI